MRRSSVAVALGALFASAHASAAEPARTNVRLVFESQSRCPPRAEFESEVAARLGYSPFASEELSTAAVSLEADDAGARAVVHVVIAEPAHEDPPEPRRELHKTLRSSKGDCAEAMRSAAASLAIFLDPTFQVPRGRPPRTTIPPAPPSQEERVLSSTKVYDAFIHGEAVSSLGLTPALSLGGGLHLGLRFGSLMLLGGAQAEASVTSRTFRAAEVSASYVGGDVEACFAPAPFVACIAGGLGRFRAHAEGSGAQSDASALFPLVGLRTGVLVPLGGSPRSRFHLWLTPQLHVPLREVTLLRSGVAVWQTPAMSASFAVGLSWAP